jgi:hypothetical protein
MPLLDHFRPPLSAQRHWEGFHARWASAISDALNGRLPPGYFAEPQVHPGSRVEMDVAAFKRDLPAARTEAGGTATLVAPAPAVTYSPPVADMRIPAVFPDGFEVLVFSSEGGPTLVAAVELVSPGNKDRGETRTAFAAKCAAYLQQGVALAVVDVVTNRQANPHNELVDLLAAGDGFRLATESLYSASYRPLRGQDDRGPVPTGTIDVWAATLALGETLPVMPLPLDRGQFVPLDLEASYTDTCRNTRLL